MKNFFISALSLVTTLTFLSLSYAAPADVSYNGEIMDSQCALLGGHSKMMAKGESAKDCTIRCVGIGGKYVLFDAAKKTRYQLDDQKKAEMFAGAKVTVSGSFDPATKTIKVDTIKPAA
jgi:hypothetical protein